MAEEYPISQLRAIHDVGCRVARSAGEYLRQDQLRRRTAAIDTREKLSSVDLVTAADEGESIIHLHQRDHPSASYGRYVLE